MTPETPEWLNVRQRAYDAALARRGGVEDPERTSHAAFHLHREIVAEVDALPVEEGGRGGARAASAYRCPFCEVEPRPARPASRWRRVVEYLKVLYR